MDLLSDSVPQYMQGREEKAGLQRLAGRCRIPALPLASWVVSGKRLNLSESSIFLCKMQITLLPLQGWHED